MLNALNGPVRVLRVITRMNIGGPAIHALLLTRELSRRGYLTLLAAGECEAGEGDMSFLLGPSDEVEWIPALSRSVSPARNLAAAVALYRLIRRFRPHVVHTHTAMAGFAGRIAAWLAGVPVVVHTYHGNSLRHYFGPAVSRAFLLVEKLLARLTDRICVIAPQQFEELARGLRVAPEERFRVVPLGLPLEGFLSLDPPRCEGGLRIGWLGRLAPVKNVPLLVEVVEHTLRIAPGVRFVVAGDGPDRALLEAARTRIGPRLEYLGWQTDVRAVLERCDVLVQTSVNEGTPVALIQGMAAGRPFASTPAGGVVDMVEGAALAKSSGARWFSNCVLIDGGAEAFALALRHWAAAAEELREMGMAARGVAVRRYQGERLVNDIDALYREALGEKKAPPEAERIQQGVRL